jgi:hypothetical protein
LPSWVWRLQELAIVKCQIKLDVDPRDLIVHTYSILICAFLDAQGHHQRAMWKGRQQPDLQGFSMGRLLQSVQLRKLPDVREL